MTADGPRAHDILLGYEPLSHYGACWYYVWQAYAAAGASTGMGSSATAYDGWNLSSGKHLDMDPPEGAAVWLGRRYDGNMSGDVFIAGKRDGDHAATDQPVYGQTGTTTLRERMNLCGREYLGWTDHVLDCPITLGSTPMEDDDMKVIPFTRVFQTPATFPAGIDTTSPHNYLRREDTGNTRVNTGPNDHTDGVLFLHVSGLGVGEVAQVRSMVATEQEDGEWTDHEIGRVEVVGNGGSVPVLLPVAVRLTSDRKILRFKVYGGDAEVTVTRAEYRGAEYSRT